MTPEQFCYWLQGRAELVAGPPDATQWAAIVQHLSLVFTKVTPPGPGQLAPGFALPPVSPYPLPPVTPPPRPPGVWPWPERTPAPGQTEIIC